VSVLRICEKHLSKLAV